MHRFCLIVVLIATSWTAAADDLPRVELHTSKGVIVLELFPEMAPKTVANFLNYVETRYYNDMIFHRVIDDWIIQAGAYTEDLNAYETQPAIRNEAANGLKNERGSVAMAHGDNPHSADSEFFFNLADNVELDHERKTPSGYGYCVFGRIVKGISVADAIGDVATHQSEGFDDLPVIPIIIKRAVVVR